MEDQEQPSVSASDNASATDNVSASVTDTAPSEESTRPAAFTPERHQALTNLGRRHPATLALIEEITAQVNAQAQRQLELAKAELRDSLREESEGAPLGGLGISILGVFATGNLLLVTVALALGQVMAPWLAGLLVSVLTFGAMSAIAVRTSQRRGWQMPFVRKLTARRFAERLSAIT